MFTSARLKLTGWYLLIIMTVSISFSAFIYKGVSLEFERRLNAISDRLQLGRFGIVPPPGQVELFVQDLEETKERVLIILVYTNFVIFVFSAGAGYFLAGRTLRPIERALEEQKRFVADASHEFKTPLTALQTSIEVTLRDKKLNLKEAKSVLKESLNDIQNLSSLSKYLLGLARFQKDNSLTKENVNIKEVTKSALKKLTPLAKDKKIQLSQNVGDTVVRANKESLEKLITILLDNAIKYTPKGGKVSINSEGGQRGILLKVTDTGIGISDKDIPHIFERFYRADIARSKDKVTGFGLGLSMAKQITQLHKGTIDVKSKLGKGSTFTVRLPL
jgi:two-component system sensor histidine kinase CiaH